MADNQVTPEEESVETPPASTAEEETPESSETVNEVSEPAEKTEVEKEWESLKGGTQDRIKNLISERNEWREKAATQAETDLNKANTIPAATPPTGDEVGQAINTLKERGMVTQDVLDSALGQLSQRMELNRKHDSLENQYSDSNNLPKYDRLEVEDHMKRKGLADPEAAFRDMYFDEFIDSSRRGPKSKVVTEKPTASSTSSREPMTVDSLRKKLRGEDGAKYYEKLAKDPAKFDSLLKALTNEAD